MTTKLAIEAYLSTVYIRGPLQHRNTLRAIALGAFLGTGCLFGEDNDTGQNVTSESNSSGDQTTSGNSSTGDPSETTPTGSGTGSGSMSNSESNSATDATTTDATTGSTGTTTTDPTATDTTTGSTGTTDATDSSSGTTGMSETGKCGWNPDKYYACDVDGGQPGVSDPDGISPIACADGLIAGEKCDGMDPVSEAGCCTPEGTLYFCDTQTDPNAPVIFQQECGV